MGRARRSARKPAPLQPPSSPGVAPDPPAPRSADAPAVTERGAATAAVAGPAHVRRSSRRLGSPDPCSATPGGAENEIPAVSPADAAEPPVTGSESGRWRYSRCRYRDQVASSMQVPLPGPDAEEQPDTEGVESDPKGSSGDYPERPPLPNGPCYPQPHSLPQPVFHPWFMPYMGYPPPPPDFVRQWGQAWMEGGRDMAPPASHQGWFPYAMPQPPTQLRPEASHRGEREEEVMAPGYDAQPPTSQAQYSEDDDASSNRGSSYSGGSSVYSSDESDFSDSGSSYLSSSDASNRRPRKQAKVVDCHLCSGRHRSGSRCSNSSPLPNGGLLVSGSSMLCSNTVLERSIRPSAKEGIRRGRYVDMFTVTIEGKKGLAEARKKGAAAEEAYRSYDNWLSGMIAFAFCYVEDRPEEGSAVFSYLHLVHSLQMQYKGTVWRSYDEQFRRRREGNRSLKLGYKDIELWLELTQFAREAPAPAQPQQAQPARKKRGKCYAFNNNSCRRGKRCIFRHACLRCNGEHPARHCTRIFPGNAKPSESQQGYPEHN